MFQIHRSRTFKENTEIMTKCKNTQERQFYILATKKYGWTKDLLINKIELQTFEKYLLGQTNFDTTLPENMKNQAILAVKDEYSWGFTGLESEYSEEELEQSIIKNIRAFLIDFGADFSFIGNQYRLEEIIICFLDSYNALNVWKNSSCVLSLPIMN